MSPRPLTDLPADALILTAGQRLARHLLAEHARAQLAAGQQAWATPDIVAWSAWLERLWQESTEAGGDPAPLYLLTPGQELALWERIVREDDGAGRLLQPAAAARLAIEAWELVHAWRVPLDDDAEPAGEDGEAFRRWAHRFDEQCRVQGLLDRGRLPDRLRQDIAARRLALPARIVLAGFDELTPQQQALLDALAQAGVDIGTWTPRQEAAAAAVRLGCPDAEEEVRAAAQWVRARLAANPTARVGLVVPDLAARRAALERALEDVLVPEALLAANGEAARAFNISLGLPLADYPPVHAALLVLELGLASATERRLPLESVSRLLRSPFLGEAEAERTRRARLDARVRRAREPFVTLSWLIAQACGEAESGQPAHACPPLAARLAHWQELLRKLPRQQGAGRWAGTFVLMLRALGWPGERAPSSGEHQTLEAWRELLSQFAALEAVLPPLDQEGALRELRRLAQDRLFQPKTPEVGVQVLGLLEASGLAFDHLWVTGLDSEAWPRPAEPNPFLPVGRQRRHRLPHASPEREFEFAQRLTARLLAAAPEVIASHALADGDRPLHPSPLIAALPPADAGAVLGEAFVLHRDVVHAARWLETLVDSQGPALAAAVARGGTAILREQSACPFRAFARFRLGASEPELAEAGLGAAERGTLVHQALEALWNELGSHAALAALDAAGQRAQVTRAVETVIDRYARRRPFTFTERFTRLERDRLVALIDEWLGIERGRAPFQVLAAETRRRLRIGALEVDARMDRVDALASGHLAVIDYKTGRAAVADWFGERPEEPQLPLYAVCGAAPGEEVAAVAFAQLRRGEQGFIGIARHHGVLPHVKPLGETRHGREHGSWESLRDHWRQVLERLAGEFRDGIAPVDPREPATCRDCALTPLCRVHELRARSGHLVLEEFDE